MVNIKTLLSCLRGALCAAFVLFSPNAKGDPRVNPNLLPRTSAVYSWTNISDDSDEEVNIKGQKIGGAFDIPFSFFQLRAAGGAQKLDVTYKDEQFKGIRNLELDLDPSFVSYFGGGARVYFPIWRLRCGLFGYMEATSREDVKVHRLRSDLPEGFDHAIINSLEYTIFTKDFGFLSGFRYGDFRLEMTVAHTTVDFDFKVKYTAAGRELIEKAGINNGDIQNGNFRRKVTGAYTRLSPAYTLGRTILGIEGDIIFTDIFSYRIGGSVGFVLPDN